MRLIFSLGFLFCMAWIDDSESVCMTTSPCSLLIEYGRVFLIAISSVCSDEEVLETLQEAEKLLEKTAAPAALLSGSTDPSM